MPQNPVIAPDISGGDIEDISSGDVEAGVTKPKAKPVGAIEEGKRQLVETGKGLKSLLGPNVGIQDVASGAFESFVKAPTRELLGRPQPGKSVLSAPQNSWDRIAGALDTFMGGDPGSGRMKALQGDTGAAQADWLTMPLATLATAGAGRLAKALKPVAETEANMGKRASALTRASGAGESHSVNFPKEFRKALPELDKTAAQSGLDLSKITMPEFGKLIQDTFSRTEQDFNQKFQPLSNQPIAAHPVANEIRSKKIANPKTPEDIHFNNQLDRAALPYETGTWTWGDLNTQRMRASDRIHDFYKLNPSAKGAKLGSNIRIVKNMAVQDATRDMIYQALENRYKGVVPAGYFKNLKQVQSALYNITDQMKGRINQLSNIEAQGFMGRIRPHSYLSSGGHIGAAIGGLGEAIFPESARAQGEVREGFKPPRDLRPALGAGAPSLFRHQEPSLAEDEEP
jgi:hypothetical protein